MCLCTITLLSAQTATVDTLYFTGNWQKTSKDKADFYRVPLTQEGDAYRVRDFYGTGEPQMSGLSSAQDKEVWEGEVVWYEKSGDVLQKATYVKGILNGPFITYLDGKKLVGQFNNNYFISGSKNIKSGRIHLFSEMKGDTLVEVIHDNDIRGIRYEQVSVGKQGNILTTYYGDKGKLIGDRKQLSNGNYEGIDVSYYYKPMRINAITDANALDYATGIYYYKNGQLRESYDEKKISKTYYDTTGTPIGSIRFTHFDGKFKAEEGTFISFYSSSNRLAGAIQVKRVYKGGELQFESYYYKDGTLKRELFYEGGDKVLQKSYDESAKEIAQITFDKWLPQNGSEITENRKVTYKDGKLIEELEFYPDSQDTFMKKLGDESTYYKRDGSILGTLNFKEGSYGTPLKGTQYTLSREGEISYEQVFNNGYKTKSTYYRDRRVGDSITMRFKRIEEFAPDSYNRTREVTFYSNGEMQSDIRYKGYDKVSGLFYDERGTQIGAYDFKENEGTRYDFFTDADEVKKLEIIKDGVLIKLQEYTYGSNSSYGAVNPVLIQDVDIDCCARFYSRDGDLIASATFKDRKPLEGTIYDIKNRERYTIKNGLRNGLYEVLDYNQTPIETGNFVAGKKEGAFKKITNRKVLLQEENYQNDLLHGLASYYDKDGMLLSQLEYRNGVPYDGVRVVRINYGGSDYQETYKDGVLVKKEIFEKSGKRVITYKDKGEDRVTVYFKDSDKKRLVFSLEKGFVDGDVLSYTKDGAVEFKATFQKGKLLSGTVRIITRSMEQDISYVEFHQEDDKITLRYFNVKDEHVFTAEELLNRDTNYRYINKLGIYRSSIYGNMLY